MKKKKMHSIDLLDLLLSITSESFILSYCSIFTTHANTHQKELVDNIYHFLQKQT